MPQVQIPSLKDDKIDLDEKIEPNIKIKGCWVTDLKIFHNISDRTLILVKSFHHHLNKQY